MLQKLGTTNPDYEHYNTRKINFGTYNQSFQKEVSTLPKNNITNHVSTAIRMMRSERGKQKLPFYIEIIKNNNSWTFFM